MAAQRIHLDPIGGIAGDMFVAAVSEAFPEFRSALLAQLAALKMPVAARARFAPHLGGVFVGGRFIVEMEGDGHAHERLEHHHHHHHHRDVDHAHQHVRADDQGARHQHEPHLDAGPVEHRHGHVSHAWIVRWLHAAELAANVRHHAIGIFRALAEAEATVHGVPVDEVEFHEVGSWDSITDIVAAAFLVDAVGDATWTCGPLPLGGGTTRTAHGVMPLPAPATLELLRGLAVVDDGVPGERVTPTGAAIVKYLVGREARTDTPMRVGASGLGFGTRRLPDRPNAVRCTQFLPIASNADAARVDHVDCIEFEVDDQSSEDLAVGLDRLRDREDVLQVFQIPVFGKKGRMAARIHLVAKDGAGDAVAQACFTETTTIGLRCQRVARRVLPRVDALATDGDERPVRVKVCERAAAHTAKAEMDDLARLPGGHAERERVRRQSEHAALAERAAS